MLQVFSFKKYLQQKNVLAVSQDWPLLMVGLSSENNPLNHMKKNGSIFQ